MKMDGRKLAFTEPVMSLRGLGEQPEAYPSLRDITEMGTGEMSPSIMGKSRGSWRPRPSGKLEVIEIRSDGSRRSMIMRMRDLMRHINSVTSEEDFDDDVGTRPTYTPTNIGENDESYSQAGEYRPRHRALHARDLRSIDPVMTQKAAHPAIVVRRHVIIANFDPLRVVVVYDRMLILIPPRQNAASIVDDILSQLRIVNSTISHIDSSDSLATNAGLEAAGLRPDPQDFSVVAIYDEEAAAHFPKETIAPVEDGLNIDDDDDNNTFNEIEKCPTVGKKKNSTIEEMKKQQDLLPLKDDDNTKKSPNQSTRDSDELLQPFELRALEAVLAVATRRLSSDCEALRPRAAQATEMLRSAGMSIEKLERLRKLKNEVSYHEARARDTAEALTEVLDEDEDMCMMRLSKLRTHPKLFNPPLSPVMLTQHEDVELLLENYLQYATATQTNLELLRLGIDNAESSFAMNLDIARNRLISVDTIFTLLSTIAGFGGVTAGIFGMNLQRDHTSFLLVTSLTVIACIFVAVTIIGLLFKFNLLLIR